MQQKKLTSILIGLMISSTAFAADTVAKEETAPPAPAGALSIEHIKPIDSAKLVKQITPPKPATPPTAPTPAQTAPQAPSMTVEPVAPSSTPLEPVTPPTTPSTTPSGVAPTTTPPSPTAPGSTTQPGQYSPADTLPKNPIQTMPNSMQGQ